MVLSISPAIINPMDTVKKPPLCIQQRLAPLPPPNTNSSINKNQEDLRRIRQGVSNETDDGSKRGVKRLAIPHEPAVQVGIVAGEQLLEFLLLSMREPGIIFLEKWNQQEI